MDQQAGGLRRAPQEGPQSAHVFNGGAARGLRLDRQHPPAVLHHEVHLVEDDRATPLRQSGSKRGRLAPDLGIVEGEVVPSLARGTLTHEGGLAGPLARFRRGSWATRRPWGDRIVPESALTEGEVLARSPARTAHPSPLVVLDHSIDFDPAKSAQNTELRSLPFERAGDCDWETAIYCVDDREEYPETRIIAFRNCSGRGRMGWGMCDAGEVLAGKDSMDQHSLLLGDIFAKLPKAVEHRVFLFVQHISIVDPRSGWGLRLDFSPISQQEQPAGPPLTIDEAFLDAHDPLTRPSRQRD